ncbi:MAG: polysaccharide deacetylase family protein [Oligoflexia bacterium]|nr:polysaccharide deacetylase family protein [Oligoflexia bacterium]
MDGLTYKISFFTVKAMAKILQDKFWYFIAYRKVHYLDGFYYILSFDCDTQEDAEAALALYHRLRKEKIYGVYAVPGELLEKHQSIYKEIAHDPQNEFINHGYYTHTFWCKERSRHESCFFYNELSPKKIIDDIRRGDQTLRNVLNLPPLGFRAPHFGCFQRPENLKLIHSTIKELNYIYSSSTVPIYSSIYGPIIKMNDLFEFPVTGTFSQPGHILDSWAFFAAPDRNNTPEDYAKELKQLTTFLNRANQTKESYLINLYVDPSHVIENDIFLNAIKELNSRAQNITYSSLLKKIEIL